MTTTYLHDSSYAKKMTKHLNKAVNKLHGQLFTCCRCYSTEKQCPPSQFPFFIQTGEEIILNFFRNSNFKKP